MESNKSHFWNKAMFWGFIIALASMLSTTIYYSLDSFFASSKSWFEYLIPTIGIILCAISFKNSLAEKDEFPYKRALGLGVATAFFSSLILALFNFVLFKYIDPDLINEILIQTEEKLLESGLGDDMIEQQIEMQSKFINPTFIAISTILGAVITGLIISLITSIFMKKKAVDGFESAMNEIDDQE